MHVDAIELCGIYSPMSRECLGHVHEDACMEPPAAGWLRPRRNPAIAWWEAEPLVRAFRELTPG